MHYNIIEELPNPKYNLFSVFEFPLTLNLYILSSFFSPFLFFFPPIRFSYYFNFSAQYCLFAFNFVYYFFCVFSSFLSPAMCACEIPWEKNQSEKPDLYSYLCNYCVVFLPKFFFLTWSILQIISVKRQKYNEFVLCMKKTNGDGSDECTKLRRFARSACLDEWVSFFLFWTANIPLFFYDVVL